MPIGDLEIKVTLEICSQFHRWHAIAQNIGQGFEVSLLVLLGIGATLPDTALCLPCIALLT